MTERTHCVYCGRPTKGGRACAAHADVERADLELNGDSRGARGSVAPPADSRHDDGPIHPPRGEP